MFFMSSICSVAVQKAAFGVSFTHWKIADIIASILFYLFRTVSSSNSIFLIHDTIAARISQLMMHLDGFHVTQVDKTVSSSANVAILSNKMYIILLDLLHYAKSSLT